MENIEVPGELDKREQSDRGQIFWVNDTLAHVGRTRKYRGTPKITAVHPGVPVRSEENTVRSEHINQLNHMKE